MQQNLFGQDNRECEKILLPNGELWWFPDWLSRRQADLYFSYLNRETSWKQSYISIAGKTLPVPRLNAWYGEKDTTYAYSGITFTPQPFNRPLNTLRARVLNSYRCQQHSASDEQPKYPFSINSALLNLYRDGSDSVAWHADDEPELGPSPQIASISLGATRAFLLKPKKMKGKIVELQLSSGSMLLMLGDIQNNWLHCIPKMAGMSQPRINITFRDVIKQ